VHLSDNSQKLRASVDALFIRLPLSLDCLYSLDCREPKFSKTRILNKTALPPTINGLALVESGAAAAPFGALAHHTTEHQHVEAVHGRR
jgi:hypothetical protein